MADENIRVRMELIDKTSDTLRRITKELNRTVQTYQKLDRVSKAGIATHERATKAIEETTFSIRDLIAELGALAIAYKGVQIAKDIADTSDEFISARARLSIVTDDPDVMFRDIYQMSQEVRTGFIDMAGTVAKMGINVGVGEGEWFKSTNQLIRFNELLAKTFKTGGQNNKEIAAGMLQLTQAMSSGRLQGDEFRSMFENAPLYISYIGSYMAKLDNHVDEFGNVIPYTAGQLKELAAESKITTDIMINAMMEGADKIEKQFDHLPIKIEEAWTMTTNMVKMQANAFLKEINQVLNTGSFLAFLDQFSHQITVILGMVTNILKVFSPVINLLMSTWILWSPFAAALLAGLGYIITKLVLLELGVTKAAVATRLATAESEALIAREKVLSGVTGYLSNQYLILARCNNEAKQSAMGFDGALGSQSYNLQLARIKAEAHAKGLHLSTLAWQHETVQILANTSAKIINTLAEKSATFAKLRARIAGNAHVVSLSGQTLATRILTGATVGLSVALNYLLLPLTIALGVMWVVIKVINKLTGSSYTLTGVIMGVLNVAITALTNGLIDLYNAGIAVWNLFSSHDKEYKARISYTAAWREGLDYGNVSSLDYQQLDNELAIKKNTDQLVDNTTATKEDMEFLRSIAEDRVSSRISNVNVNIVNNNDMQVNGDRDLDGIVDYITTQLTESLNTSVSGAHL